MKIFVAAAADPVVPDWRVFGHGLVAGLIAAVAVTAVLALLAFRQRRVELPGGAQWKFTDSWASNLTALTAAFAALLAAFSGKLDTAIAPGASAAFAVASALYVAIAACAPIAYTVGQVARPQGKSAGLEGSRGGLVGAAFLTLWSVFSSLGSVVFVLQYGAIGAIRDYQVLATILLAVMALLVAAYAVRTIHWLLTVPATGTALPGITGFTCCEPPAAVVTRRVFLL
ncbi:hypothetical protein [Amycolatopsis sp. Hca4]|uniref:hypothetical protein n=1 Tax=Amycolatopsis sp. Hca4 TaxID=2742131 RepID=UPI00158FAC5D|nr:hypothetical protein [Amycolatopsis sp. Hca4]QKV75613.1 hypothetical protein HUT10_18960 [Amycolatopsis sp. Hca4]